MPYEDFIRTRITELRIAKDVSEHRMSLDLEMCIRDRLHRGALMPLDDVAIISKYNSEIRGLYNY